MKDNQTIIYAGVNFVFHPQASLDLANRIEFQKKMEEIGINFNSYTFNSDMFLALRSIPLSLEVRIANINQQLGQIVIVANQISERSLETLCMEACDITKAFSEIWPHRQIVSTDTTLRVLFDSSHKHSFVELWEGLLKQQASDLGLFNRPVLGGGLRFVLPPIPDPNNPNHQLPNIDLKIETFIQDTAKIFVELQCLWGQSPEMDFDPDNKLEFTENFIKSEVMQFMKRGG